jgi:hypothetical protein
VRPALLLSLLLAAPAWADWQFDAAVDVAGPRDAFHHIEASGRQALAVSAGRVALAWEDDRSGSPRCYLAIRPAGAPGFGEHAFGQGECYAPGLAALADGRFALIWEDEAGVNAALATEAGIGPAANLAPAGGQGALAWQAGQGLMAAWSQPDGRWRRVWLATLALDGERLRAADRQPADAQAPRDDQMYPALAATGAGHTVVWEDRRLGHTVVYASQRRDGAWSAPLRISQNHTGRAQGTDLGRGTGAMRPALAAAGKGLTAVWLDKRDFLSGYDVYAASAGEDGRFGRNTKVQDSFGDAIAQWHAAVAGNGRGELAVAWDDDRDGNPDVWLSWPREDGYADNVAAASGANPQSDPAIALDDEGNLHLAWVERQPDGHTGIRYRRGRPAP